MAINLWKVAGKPTSYSPLSNFDSVMLNVMEYVVSFRAKSVKNGTLRVYDAFSEGSGYNIDQSVVLSSEFKTFSFTFNSKYKQLLYIHDTSASGDIIIESIELVQKPLPKLTINGIDGFKAPGKWTLHANAQAIDDETLVLNATAQYQNNKIVYDVVPGTNYTLSRQGDGWVWGNGQDKNGTFVSVILNATKNLISTFTIPNNVYKLELSFTNYTDATGQFIFKKPCLNLGSIPAPYSKKTGDKMVLPVWKSNFISPNESDWELGGTTASVNVSQTLTRNTSSSRIRPKKQIDVLPNTGYIVNFNPSNLYQVWVFVLDSNDTILYSSTYTSNAVIFTTPSNGVKLDVFFRRNTDAPMTLSEINTIRPQITKYAVQVNKKPQRWVAKKNLFDGSYDAGTISVNSTTNTLTSATDPTARTTKWIKCLPNKTYTISGGNRNRWQIKSLSGTITYTDAVSISTLSDSSEIRCYYSSDGSHTLVQLEEGTTPTAYEKHELILPRAKTGLSFEPTRGDYFQLPSMTMNSIEIDCLIDSVQPQANPVVLDARTGLTDGYLTASGSAGTSWQTKYVDGVLNGALIKGQRTKIKLIAPSSFTDNVVVFANYIAGQITKGILYKVTCYLNGAIVAQYDFENPQNVVGDKVLQQAKNLIPSFEDPRWSLHSNFKVLGKDVGRLEATAGDQTSTIWLECLPNTTYLLRIEKATSDRYVVDEFVSKDGLLMANYAIKPVTLSNFLFITTSSTTKLFKIRLYNPSATPIGAFDFIKPQIYQLDGKEGTIVGKPIAQRKVPKRSLYNKR